MGTVDLSELGREVRAEIAAMDKLAESIEQAIIQITINDPKRVEITVQTRVIAA